MGGGGAHDTVDVTDTFYGFKSYFPPWYVNQINNNCAVKHSWLFKNHQYMPLDWGAETFAHSCVRCIVTVMQISSLSIPARSSTLCWCERVQFVWNKSDLQVNNSAGVIQQ